MVVDHHLLAREGEQFITQRTNTFRVVEIGTNNQIRLLEKGIRLSTLALVDNVLIGLGQPRQEIRKSVRHNHRHLFALRLQEMAHRQGRAHGIAIGRHVGENNDIIRLIDKLLRGLNF